MKDRCNSVDVALSGEPRKFLCCVNFFFCVFFSILHLTSSRNIVFLFLTTTSLEEREREKKKKKRKEEFDAVNQVRIVFGDLKH